MLPMKHSESNRQKFIEQYMNQIQAREKRKYAQMGDESTLNKQSPLIISKLPSSALCPRRKGVLHQKSVKISQSPYTENYPRFSINTRPTTQTITCCEVFYGDSANKVNEETEHFSDDPDHTINSPKNNLPQKTLNESAYIFMPHPPPVHPIHHQYTGLSCGKAGVRVKKLSVGTPYLHRQYSEDCEAGISFTDAINVTSYRGFKRGYLTREAYTRGGTTKNRQHKRVGTSISTTKGDFRACTAMQNSPERGLEDDSSKRNAPPKRPGSSMTKYKRHSVFTKCGKAGAVRLTTMYDCSINGGGNSLCS